MTESAIMGVSLVGAASHVGQITHDTPKESRSNTVLPSWGHKYMLEH